MVEWFCDNRNPPGDETAQVDDKLPSVCDQQHPDSTPHTKLISEIAAAVLEFYSTKRVELGLDDISDDDVICPDKESDNQPEGESEPLENNDKAKEKLPLHITLSKKVDLSNQHPAGVVHSCSDVFM